jgi:pimeloyl-ACP methyl ester carboxylesterase
MSTTSEAMRAATGADGLHWEARGAGTPVLLLPGAPGDGRQFDAVADELATEHLVVTYDRRGTSRSAWPQGWATTTVAEQADDAAAVLARVGCGPAVVYGTSNGGLVALELMLRSPGSVAGVLLHELPMLSVVADPEPVVAAMGAMIGSAMEQGGSRAALEAFLRFAFGDAVVDRWSPEVREQLFSNGDVVFGVELPAFQAYRPDETALRANRVPVTVLVGEDEQVPFFREAAEWLATRLDTTVAPSPGAHGPQFTHPSELAALIHRDAASYANT